MCVLFFKQKTAYEMRISDWSSDVCSSDLRIAQLKRGEFAPWAFETWRYLSDGTENPDFILNQEPFRRAGILISGANFGCGSSREMAVWALEEFGLQCIVAESYGDIDRKSVVSGKGV